MKQRISITVFTATYNRAWIIQNLYESLKRQTSKNFEWLVVDDGSTDGTRELINQWSEKESGFAIRYYYQSNGGKCRAINRGLELAASEWFFTVDSDDYLTDSAIEKIENWTRELTVPTFAGIVANRGYTEYETSNYIFSEEYLDKSLLDIYSFKRNGKQVFDGERAFIFRTDIHRAYLYPEFEGENFMTEAVAWNRMAHAGYKMRFYNDIIWIFEYKDDGLTKAGNRLFKQNPHGYGLWLREKARFENKGLFYRMKMVYTFSCELHGMYERKVIAECIQTSALFVGICQSAHRFLSIIREGRK